MQRQTEPEVSAAKRELRQRILAARAMLPAGELAAAGAAIADAVLRLPDVAAARVVAAYVGVGVEVPTDQLIEALVDRGTTVLLPRLEPDDTLSWYAVDGLGDLVRSRRGLLEPTGGQSLRNAFDAQVVVLPGLAYDLAGHRLGRGGGSYDRTLHGKPAGLVTVGIALDCDIIGAVPVQRHDQPVDIIVTPTAVITTEGGH